MEITLDEFLQRKWLLPGEEIRSQVERGCDNREEGLLLATAEEAFPAETSFKKSSIFYVIYLDIIYLCMSESIM